VAIVLVTVLAAACTLQRRLIYFPSRLAPDLPVSGLKGAAPVAFTTSDGFTLNGWFVGARGRQDFTVIVFPGNAGNRTYRVPLANALSDRGAAVLLFDYRGFGGNPGSPTETGLRADARAAREHVISRTDVDRGRVVYFGESLGAAVAAELAVEHPPAALILRSPFTSLTDVAQHHYGWFPVRWVLRDRFATIDRISSIRAPLLVIGGDADRIVPISQTRRVYEAARDPKRLVVIPNADHNDYSLLAGAETIDAVVTFLSAHN
jgi:fermentation-respiration switch protein FrsA (DUF1100 family)